ncbi:hypothetical protein AX15_006073 [Amanita polypyramis BW_CC]|nr:hypothetical protein AX15_006073 [Amanita polypyramis BW_CC]
MDSNHHIAQQGPDDPSGAVLTSTSAMATPYAYNKDRLEYELVVRQEPKQARMCGVGGKADRRPIDPPPIVQLRVIDPNARSSPRRRRSSASGSDTESPSHSDPSNSRDAVSYAQSYLQNPYYFMFASLAKPDDDAELHWLKDGRTRCTTGSVVSSLYHLKDPQNNNEDAGFFVFPDLSVRTEGSYRLKLSLFEVVGNNVRHCKSIYSAPFYVYTAKKFPGMEESTPLSCSLADQGIKIRIRKDIRIRKRPIQALEPLQPLDDPLNDHDDDEREADRDGKRPLAKKTRTDDPSEPSINADSNALSTSQPSQQWPPAPIDPNLVPIIPPPPSAQSIPPPSNHDNSTAAGGVLSMNATPAYDGRTPGYSSYEAQTQPQQLTQQSTQPATVYRPDPGQLHQPSSQQQAPPPPPQQQYVTPHHPPPPAQHMPPPSHIPPPSTGHVTHHAGPHIQQSYAPYPSQAWPAPPPQPQQQMYDLYAHYHHPQHPPHPHYSALPPPAPPRYEYTTPMYAQAPAPYPYPYYDQPPYTPVPTGTSSPSSSVGQPVAPPSTMPPPAPPATGYAEYGANPYGRGASPQPRVYHPHTHPQPHYGPYPPHLPPHPQHQPRHYAPLPPPHPYGYAYGHPPPVPTADQWGAPTTTYAPPVAWGDAYSAQQVQPTTSGPTAPNASTITAPASSSMPTNANGLAGAVNSDRIRLAPLRASAAPGSSNNSGVADANPVLSHGLPGATSTSPVGASSARAAYPVLHPQSNGRGTYDTARDDRDDRGGRSHERLGGRTGKNNPLKIGNIILN